MKISRQLVDECNSHPVFFNNSHVIPAVYKFLKMILRRSDINNEIYSIKIHDIFLPYTTSYKQYIDALAELGLITVDEDYITSDISKDGIGHCKKYDITMKGSNIIHNLDKVTIQDLRYNKIERRKNQKNISKRGVKKIKYNDVVLDHQHNGLINTEFNLDIANRIIDATSNDKSKAIITDTILTYEQKDFNPIKIGEKDNRIYTEHTQMKSILRNATTYKGNPRIAVIDIRSCHWTFFAMNLYQYQYLPRKSLFDINEEELKVEVNKWINQMCDPSVKPKLIISEALNISTEDAKNIMNAYINGYSCEKLDVWFNSKYPCLYKVFSAVNKKEVGLSISKYYETVLMQDKGLYKFGEDAQLQLQIEHDGLSVYPRKKDYTDTEVKNKIQYIINYLQNKSISVFGVPVVFSVNYQDQVTLNQLIYQTEYDSVETKYINQKNLVNKLRKKAHVVDTKKMWDLYHKENNIFIQLQKELVDVYDKLNKQ